MRINLLYPGAYAKISGNGIYGRVDFYQRPESVMVVARINKLPESMENGFFGLHIHEGKSCTGEDFSDTKAHYDKGENPHPMHSGDMPPLFASGGRAYLAFLTSRFSVSEILGKTVVIHSMADDFTSQPSGNAGKKIACGVIREN